MHNTRTADNKTMRIPDRRQQIYRLNQNVAQPPPQQIVAVGVVDSAYSYTLVQNKKKGKNNHVNGNSRL